MEAWVCTGWLRAHAMECAGVCGPAPAGGCCIRFTGTCGECSIHWGAAPAGQHVHRCHQTARARESCYRTRHSAAADGCYTNGKPNTYMTATGTQSSSVLGEAAERLQCMVLFWHPGRAAEDQVAWEVGVLCTFPFRSHACVGVACRSRSDSWLLCCQCRTYRAPRCSILLRGRARPTSFTSSKPCRCIRHHTPCQSTLSTPSFCHACNFGTAQS